VVSFSKAIKMAFRKAGPRSQRQVPASAAAAILDRSTDLIAMDLF
jgi:hypothetical protein